MGPISRTVHRDQLHLSKTDCHPRTKELTNVALSDPKEWLLEEENELYIATYLISSLLCLDVWDSCTAP
ncbi:hypothetical protein BGZ65_010818, partial [Modicella reniformis]